MADFLSGFIGKGIDIAVDQILHHANIALSCRKELNSLRDLVTSIKPIAAQIHQYRLQLNRERGTSPSRNNASQWVQKLHGLLQQALPIVQQCTIPSFNVCARYRMSRNISNLISEIEKHLKLVSLIQFEQQSQMHIEMRRESGQASSSTSASTSRALAPTRSFFIEDSVIIGQEQDFQRVEKLVIDDAEVNSLLGIGVVGKGGSGKTLLLKTVFNSQKVKTLLHDGLLLWLTVSRSPSFSSLRIDLCQQIAVQTNEQHDQRMNEEHRKRWLSQRMRAKRFALFLDDVWGEGGKLLEELGLSRRTEHSNSKIIVSSRNRRALVEMGIADASTMAVGDLSEDESWELFAHHAFPYNHGNPPSNIDKTRAKLVCDKCGGLPLAIKVTGRAMAGITDAREWEFAILTLPGADSEDHHALHESLRWSYDALGNYDVNLQLCFLYLAAFKENEIFEVESELIPLWLGEGLLERNELRGHDPFEMGRIYANVLVDRCLIEAVLKDVDGHVVRCRMHDVLRGLAIQIAEQEENFYCRSGKGLKALLENEYSGCTRLFLRDNEFNSLPKSLTASEICSLVMGGNKITEIPRKVIGSMISLKVLDLGGASVESLPKSVGCLKQLVYLNLRDVPIKRLPAAVTNLASLQILDLCKSGITELPCGIDKLTSLRYLDLSGCDDLQCLPPSISRLTSLQYLDTWRSRNVWRSRMICNVFKKAASINDLRSLTQLKTLRLSNNNKGAEAISEETLGSMLQMETLELQDTMMRSLPRDMVNMSKLERLHLKGSRMVKMHDRFCEFHNLIHLKLWRCDMLKELPELHKLKSLKQLDICDCSRLKKFPEEFGEKGAFSLLEIFSLVRLRKLEELPTIVLEEGVMPSLKIFTLLKCEALKRLPENYLYLKALKKIRVYGCSMVLENLEKMKIVNTKVEVVTMSIIDTNKIIEKYIQICKTKEGLLYSEVWYNELYLFLGNLERRL